MASYDIIGNIAVIKPEIEGKPLTKAQKLKQAKKLLKQNNIKTILEKTSDVKGRLRTIKTKYLAGEKTKITIHKESNCKFKLNIDTCYFSPRQSNCRITLASRVKKTDNLLVMFSGIASYPIVVYKKKKPKHITAIEISKECNKYAKENLKLNNIPTNKIKLIQGDVKLIIPILKKQKQTFNVIMMARPNLKTTFLEQALAVSKRGTKIFYHGFCRKDELSPLKNQLINEAKKLKRKIKILSIKKVGEIAPFKFRWRLEMKVEK